MYPVSKTLNTIAAAAEIGVSPYTLRLWRLQGRGPRFIKYGTSKQSHVRYDAADIEAWKAEHKFASSSAYSPAAQANFKPAISSQTDAKA